MANRIVAYAFTGIKCAVAFLILNAGADMLFKIEKKPLTLCVFFSVLAFLLLGEVFAVEFSSIVLILLGGLLGILVHTLSRKKEAA